MDDSEARYAKISAYIDAHPAAVLGTIDDNGNPHGAVIFITTASNRTLCFVTKARTAKFNNLKARPMISLTFFSERDSSTLQISGKAEPVDEPALIDYVMSTMQKKHAMQEAWAAPITKVNAGEMVVVGVTIASARLTEYQSTETEYLSGPAITEL